VEGIRRKGKGINNKREKESSTRDVGAEGVAE